MRTSLIILVLLTLGCATLGSDLGDVETEDAEDRQEAVVALGERLREDLADSDRARVVESLQAALKDKNGHVRMVAASALGAGGARESIPAIAPLLEDGSWGVRHAAIVALRALDDRDRSRSLSRILRQDPNAHCRHEAARSLGALRLEDGAEACIAALTERETDPGVRHAAWEALKAISGEDRPPHPEVWREWWAERTAATGPP